MACYQIGSLDSKFESLVLPLQWDKFDSPGLAQITERFDSCITIACNKFLELSKFSISFTYISV